MILTICTSRKGETGRLGRPSAVRSLLAAAREGLGRAGQRDVYVDFATLDLPPFEGVALADYDTPDARTIAAAMAEAKTILLGVPAYWGGVSGLAKNLIDLSGGADYSGEPPRPGALAGKQVALLIVGAADGDAARARAQLVYALEALGASPCPQMLVLDRPRQHDGKQLIRQAFALGVAIGRGAAT